MKLLLILSLLFCYLQIFAQNTYRFSQFNMVKSIYNPAALATDASITADLIYRNQWAGVEGAPSTAGLNGAYELTEEMAVGINFYNDRIGLNQTNSISAMYAYRLIFDTRKYLAFGLGLGVDNVVSGFANANTIMQNDPAFSQSVSRTALNGSFGIYYRTTNFYVGASIPQLFQNSMTFQEKGINPFRWHYTAITGYYLELGENFILNPNLQIKAAINVPVQGDILMRGISNNLGFSLGFRSEKSLIAGLDYTFSQMVRVGYAVNYDIGSLARTKGMSHEVHIGLGLPYYYNSSNGFSSRKYVGRKGGSKIDYKRRYQRGNKKH